MSSELEQGIRLEDTEDILNRYAFQIGSYIEDELEDIRSEDTDRFATVVKFRAKDLPGASYSTPVVGKALHSLQDEVDCFTKENSFYRVHISDADELSEALMDVDILPTYEREIATIERMVRDSSEVFRQKEDVKEAFIEEMKSFDEEYAESIDMGMADKRLERSNKLNYVDGEWMYGDTSSERIHGEK